MSQLRKEPWGHLKAVAWAPVTPGTRLFTPSSVLSKSPGALCGGLAGVKVPPCHPGHGACRMPGAVLHLGRPDAGCGRLCPRMAWPWAGARMEGRWGPQLRPGPWGGAQSAGGTCHPRWADQAPGPEGPGLLESRAPGSPGVVPIAAPRPWRRRRAAPSPRAGPQCALCPPARLQQDPRLHLSWGLSALSLTPNRGMSIPCSPERLSPGSRPALRGAVWAGLRGCPSGSRPARSWPSLGWWRPSCALERWALGRSGSRATPARPPPAPVWS